MADSTASPMNLSSYSTACVFLPAASLQSRLNAIRVVHDKAGTRWPAHFTALFPFVDPAQLPEAAARLQAAVSDAALQPFSTVLDHVDAFTMRGYRTVYLAPSPASSASMQTAWKVAASTFQYNGRAFVPHLTLGQTPHTDSELSFLTAKGDALIETGLQWETSGFILLRKDDADGGRMKIAHVVDFRGSSSPFALSLPPPDRFPAYMFSPSESSWLPAPNDAAPLRSDALRFATYNVLEDERFPFSSRAASIVDAVLESGADVVALQEISAISLCYLLEVASLRERGYCWCTHGPSAVFPLHRNLAVISRIPFASWGFDNLGDKLKPVVLLSLPRIAAPNLTVVALHLSAGYSPEISAKRAKEVNNLVTLLRLQYASDDWVVFGDTNLQVSDSNPDSSALEDAWEVAGSRPDLEATFEPELNSLAAQTSRQDSSPKRYDRIFVKGGRFTVESFSRFGLPSSNSASPGSDHWGVAASLRLGVSYYVATTKASQQAVVPQLQLVDSSLTDSDLLQTVERSHLIPDGASLAARQAAVDAVATVVCSRAEDALTGSATVCIRLAPVGSFALGVSVPASDVDCLAVGNISSDTFWELIRSRLRALGFPNSHHIRLRRFVKDATVRMMELSIGDIKVDLQYCPAPRVAESWDSIPTLPSDSSVFSLPVSSLRTLNAYRDSLALRSLVPVAQLPAFRLAHRSLRHFCKRRGIWASKYGYLGSFHLSILLVRLLGLLPPSVSASQLVRSFVSHYSSWAWDKDAVYVGPAREYARSGREAMVILSPEKPSLNVSSSASRSSVQVFSRALKDAERLLASGASWEVACGTGLGAFLSHRRFAKIDVTYWGTDSMTGRGLVGHLESRFVHLLVQLQTALPGLKAQLWPERLADATSNDQDVSLQAFYLIGLSGLDVDATVQTRLALLEAFAEDIRGHARYYDSASSFVYASEVADNQLGAVAADTFVWPDGGIDEAEAEESDDEDAATRADVDGFARSSEFALSRKKKDKKAKAAAKRDTPPAATGGTAKLRSSADVYNRLMWDSSVSREDYMIGYEDRFKGVKEMPLGSWKREVEDEAFIPFHRVVHFRRKSDNVYVWDRGKRIDLLFGSGITLASS